jgi:hypothetical protein
VIGHLAGWSLKYLATFTAFLMLGAAVSIISLGGAPFVLPLALIAPLFVPVAFVGAVLYALVLVLARSLSHARALAILCSPLAVSSVVWGAARSEDLFTVGLALLLAPVFGAVVPLPAAGQRIRAASVAGTTAVR